MAKDKDGVVSCSYRGNSPETRAACIAAAGGNEPIITERVNHPVEGGTERETIHRFKAEHVDAKALAAVSGVTVL